MLKPLTLLAALALGACTATHIDAQPSADAGSTPCIIVGCSSHLCVANTPNNQGVVSTCEFRPQYACYPKFGTCERQSDGPNKGECGWTKTTQLDACLNDPSLAKQPGKQK